MDVDPGETALWKAAFANKHCKTVAQKAARANLLSQLQRLQEYVADLLSKIPEDCRGLTLHDIAHVHQLWDVASRLCGTGYPINPLEGFVLGAAFLIHDAGLTAAAYPNGVVGLKTSSQYRELVSNALKRADPDLLVDDLMIDAAPMETADRALFAVLRDTHAERAEKLLDRSYVHPITKMSFTLIPADLLLDTGEVIGEVAASHHWNIRKVDHTFGDPLSPPAAYFDWTIDAVKLACILRAADACAIDERRARTMAFIIENPRGVSRSHWAFQNLLKPGHRPESGEALVFDSKRAFPRDEMDSWWVAYDAIRIADDELRACDRLLKRRAGNHGHAPGAPLKAKRVEGAGDPEALSKFVRVEGWRPVDASARIDDPLAVIESLGGLNLYGNDASAPLRELLQNAADAVRVRRWRNGYDPEAGEFPGKIEVIVARPKTISESWTLTIVDDGVGMPADVLTGEFLDFGKSLWRSDRLTSVYPGLAVKKNFRPTGRFGIGFYSAFIIADDVKVMTKPYLGGNNDRLVLHFKRGVRGRAEFRSYDQIEDEEWPHTASTVVRLAIKNLGWLGRFAHYAARNNVAHEEIKIEDERFWKMFAKSLEMLIYALDVSTVLTCPFITSFSANKIDPFKLDNQDFVAEWNRVFGEHLGRRQIDPKLHTLIDFIGDEQQSRSRGCISTTSMMGQGVLHAGGFTLFNVNNNNVQGIVEYTPITTNRQGVKFVESSDAFREWGNRQLRAPDFNLLEPPQLSEAIITLWNMKVDLEDYYFLWDSSGSMVFFRDMELVDAPTIFLALGSPTPYEPLSIGQFYVSMQVGNSIKLSSEFTYALGNNFGFSSSYNRIDLQLAPDDRTAFGRLVKLIEGHGFDVKVEGPYSYIVGHYTGPDGGVAGHLKDMSLKTGAPVHARGMVMRTKPISTSA